jgi:DNA-binding MarR family transcriptional regulator
MKSPKIEDHLHEIAHLFQVLIKGIVYEESKHGGQCFITPPQFAILSYIIKTPDCMMTDVSREFDIKLSSVTGMMDRLENEGYISRTRSRDDRRVVRVNVTSKGSGIVKAKEQKHNKQMKYVLELLSEHERKCFVSILRKISDAIKTKKGENIKT